MSLWLLLLLVLFNGTALSLLFPIVVLSSVSFLSVLATTWLLLKLHSLIALRVAP